MLDIRVMSLDGSGMTTITPVGGGGTIIGQVADGMLCHVGSPGELVGAPTVPIRRYVSTDFVEVTGCPEPYTDGTPPYYFHTYGAVACHNDTAILGAVSFTAGGGHEVILYRSTDRGLAFTEVKRWTVSATDKGQRFQIGYNGETLGSWWTNRGEDGGGEGALYHSVDDGLTWTLVSTATLGAFDDQGCVSAGRPGSASA